MSVDIFLPSEFLDDSPSDSQYLHFTIICGALKFCLGTSKAMSFTKLAYIFDKTMRLEDGAFNSKMTLSPWLISSDFKKSLIIAESLKFIELNVDSKNSVRTSNLINGDEFINEIENIGVFKAYIDYLLNAKVSEVSFESPVIRYGLNED